MDIVPSFLGIESIGGGSSFSDSYENLTLRFGEVQDIVYASEKNSFSNQVTEYSVFVQHRENGTSVNKMYYHCVLMNTFAGMADKLYFTLRKGNTYAKIRRGDAIQTSADASHKDSNIVVGSKVLLLCVNGDTNNAVIIGGLRDQSDLLDVAAKELGHHFRFNFNGIDATINKDGELELQYQGKTNDDGTTNKEVDGNAPGTTIKFHKNGTLDIHTANGQSITIDNDSGNINVSSSGNVEIESSGVLTGAATDATMMGTTYRTSESAMHAQMQAALTQMSTSLAAAAFTLGNGSLATAGAAASQLQAAVAGFEGKSATYLSTKNKSD